MVSCVIDTKEIDTAETFWEEGVAVPRLGEAVPETELIQPLLRGSPVLTIFFKQRSPGLFVS